MKDGARLTTRPSLVWVANLVHVDHPGQQRLQDTLQGENNSTNMANELYMTLDDLRLRPAKGPKICYEMKMRVFQDSGPVEIVSIDI